MELSNRGCCADATLRELAAEQHGVITRQQAFAAGMTARMVQWRLVRGLWLAQHPGVYRVAGAPQMWHQGVMGATLATGGVASYRTAARLWRLDGDWGERIEVTAPGSRAVKGVMLHHSRVRVERARREGIACTTATRTLIDLSSVLSPERLEEALDSALREHLTSVGHLQERLSTRGRRGLGILRELVASRADERPHESVKEAELSRQLMAAGLARPVRQYELWRDGKVVARFDLAWPDVQIAVEFVSYRHHHGRQAWRRDAGRANRAMAEGWLVFVATEGGSLHEVAQAFARRRAA